MLRWALVYVVSIAAIAVGVVAAVQTHSLRDARRELSELQAHVDQIEKARRSTAGQSDDLKRQLREASALVEEERARRAGLEKSLEAATGAAAKADSEKHDALKAVADGEAAARRERELRETAEQALAKALDDSARDKAEVAREKAELARLEAEVARLKSAPPALARQPVASPGEGQRSGVTTGSTGTAAKPATVTSAPVATPGAAAPAAKPKAAAPKVAAPLALGAGSNSPPPRKPLAKPEASSSPFGGF